MRCAFISSFVALALLARADRGYDKLQPDDDDDDDDGYVHHEPPNDIEVDSSSALLVIDVQDCFVGESYTSSGKPGSLDVAWEEKLPDQTVVKHDAGEIIDVVNKLRNLFHKKGGHVIFSQDLHPRGHISFASTHGAEAFTNLKMMCIKPTDADTDMSSAYCCPEAVVEGSKKFSRRWGDYKDGPQSAVLGPLNKACKQCKDNPTSCFKMNQFMWPDHCMAEKADGMIGDGATWPTKLGVDRNGELELKPGEEIVKKGTNSFVDAYSAFFDNTKNYQTEMHKILQGKKVNKVFVTGIAESVCVKETAMDALRMTPEGKHGNGGAYEVYVIEDATAGLDRSSMSQAATDMAADQVDNHKMKVVMSAALGV